MASKSTATIPSISIPGRITSRPGYGSNVSVFQRGSGLAEDTTIGSEIELKLEDGTVLKGTVSATYVGALIDMISSYGPQSIYTYAQPYSARGLVAALGTEGEVLDVTKFYSVIVIAMSAPPIPTP